MIDINIHFEPRDAERKLGLEFAELNDSIRKHVYYLAHTFSLLNAKTVVFDIRTRDGRQGVALYPIFLKSPLQSQRILESIIKNLNYLLSRSAKNPAFVFNPCSTPSSYECFA